MCALIRSSSTTLNSQYYCWHLVHMLYVLCLVGFLCTVVVYFLSPYPVWVHTFHLALHVASWVGPHLSCGLHHTVQAHVNTCHFQPHVAGCVAPTLLHCPFMPECVAATLIGRIAVCFAATLFNAPGVLLPPSLLASGGCCCIGCVAFTLPCTRVHSMTVVPFTSTWE